MTQTQDKLEILNTIFGDSHPRLYEVKAMARTIMNHHGLEAALQSVLMPEGYTTEEASLIASHVEQSSCAAEEIRVAA